MAKQGSESVATKEEKRERVGHREKISKINITQTNELFLWLTGEF